MIIKFYPFLNNYCHIILLLIGAAFSSASYSYSFHGVHSFAPTVIHTASTAATETDQLLQSIQQLDLSARSSLDSGKVYKKVRQRQRFVEAWVVQDIHASPEEIWGVLIDFNKYSTRIPAVTLSEIYAIEAPPQQQQAKLSANAQRRNHRSRGGLLTTEGEERLWSYYAHFQVKFLYWVLSWDCYIRYTLFGFTTPNDTTTTTTTTSSPRLITWTLDPNREMETTSPLKACTGLWYVLPHPTQPAGWSRVYFSIQIHAQKWVPPLLIRLWKKKAISMATLWIPRYFAKATIINEGDGSLSIPSSKSPPYCNALNGPLVSGSINHVATACPWSEPTTTSIREEQQQSIGIVRYILVVMVFLLTLANLYLFLERMVT